MTVEQFLALPETPAEFYYELHHGELVKMTRPKLKHSVRQTGMRKLFEGFAELGSYVEIEFAFRALPEYEFRVADVAYVSAARFAACDLEGHFAGVPDIVVEVLSPSNTAAEMLDKETLCLENGGCEFWVIDDKRQTVKITTSSGITKTYRIGDSIPLPLFNNATLAVADIFSVLK